MTDYAAVLAARYPDAEWVLSGGNYSGLTWLSDSQKPTEDELAAAWPAVQSEVKWAEVRRERDKRLAACDWTQVADAPVDSAAWAVYRQTLRDIPQDFTTPDEVVWPTPPV